jgi:uncharacterized protein YcfJ
LRYQLHQEIEMNPIFRTALTAVAAVLATQAFAQVTFYENNQFQGRTFTAQRAVNDFTRFGYNDRASSAVVQGSRWEVCEDIRFGGRCSILRPGRYASLSVMNLNNRISSVRPVGRNARVNDDRYAPLPASAQAIFYENASFQGRTLTADANVEDFERYGFSDRASSVVVLGQRWEVCADRWFRGQCMVLNPGRYASLAAMGMNDRVSSVRMVDWTAKVNDDRYAPRPDPVYDSRRRNEERLYEATVTSVRAVVGPAEQRCWMEREEVAPTKGGLNVGGAVLGGLLGGILGHQVGGGVGKDLATVGGAVAGAAVGANVGRTTTQQAPARDVQRCATQPNEGAAPAYWDVTYTFRGQEHRVQLTAAPGSTITVNEQGEPRT